MNILGEKKEKEEKKEFRENLKSQWKAMWLQRIDDRVRAEGIADKDYSSLFVERGTVIVATRKFKPPDFFEILQQHGLLSLDNPLPPSPFVGGWRKFIRTFLKKRQKRSLMQRPSKPSRKKGQQLKKGGRGWLHRGA